MKRIFVVVILLLAIAGAYVASATIYGPINGRIAGPLSSGISLSPTMEQPAPHPGDGLFFTTDRLTFGTDNITF